MIILGIDTATSHLSIALLKNEKVLAEYELKDSKNHSMYIMQFIQKVLDQSHIKKSQIDLICVNSGPGSFTSLRVGISTARALSQFGRKPIVSIHSFQILIENVFHYSKINQKLLESAYIVPILDARKKRVYSSIFKQKQSIEGNLDIEPNELLKKLKSLNKKVILLGSGVDLYHDVWDHLQGQAIYLEENENNPHAKHCALLGWEYFLKNGDMGYHKILPNYIRISDAEESVKMSLK